MNTPIKIIIIVLICAVLLVPIPSKYKDGGTVEFNAILYSVRKEHSLSSEGGYNVGTRVRILLWTVYDDVKYEPKAK